MRPLDQLAAAGAEATSVRWHDMPPEAQDIYRRQAVGVLHGLMALAGADTELKRWGTAFIAQLAVHEVTDA